MYAVPSTINREKYNKWDDWRTFHFIALISFLTYGFFTNYLTHSICWILDFIILQYCIFNHNIIPEVWLHHTNRIYWSGFSDMFIWRPWKNNQSLLNTSLMWMYYWIVWSYCRRESILQALYYQMWIHMLQFDL